MESLAWVMAGGGFGAALRFIVFRKVAVMVKHIFPWPTLVVNLTGSFVMGFLLGSFENHFINEQTKAFLFIGFLGSYTTFSSISNEVVLAIREKLYKTAIADILIHNIGGIALALLGFYLGNAI
ncbi:MAG: fluoride efflux transporter CrcB [Leptospirales bacterium]